MAPEMWKRDYWNDRYAASDLVWGAEPNVFVAEALAGLPAQGAALDLACGEGRNAVWLAGRGWRVTAVDFSGVALARGAERASRLGVEVAWVEADVTRWEAPAGAFGLIVVAYLQLPSVQMTPIWRAAARALEPGGELFGIGHAASNLERGTGGPRDPDVLWAPEGIARELRAAGLEVSEAAEVTRAVADAPRPALDARIRARRPAGAT